ncbi:MAG TPA: hypothetical protein VEQ11_13770 [Chloroflexota bacterium]|nr:hypothetical protein [Chloroflexota bacterium]
MCGSGADTGIVAPTGPGLGRVRLTSEDQLLALARHLCSLPEKRSAHVGSIGYGGTREGDRVLVAVDRHYDPDVVRAVVAASRERGARVDLLERPAATPGVT